MAIYSSISSGLIFLFSNALRTLLILSTDNIEKRAGLLKFQIETVVGMYRFSKEGGGIATPIHTLTIDLGRFQLNLL